MAALGKQLKGLRENRSQDSTIKTRTAMDLNMKFVIIAIIVIIVVIAIAPDIPVSFSGALMIAVFGFFFSTVSSRMVGLVGGSNNPVSGMAIATLLLQQ